MPAVQSAFGPIVEPGWPELKGPDLAAGFLSGFQIAASANAKQKQLENQLARYALQAQSDAADRELDQKRYQLAVDRLQQQGDFKDQALDLQARGIDLREKTVNLALDKYNNRIEGNRQLLDAVASVPYSKDDPRFPDAFLNLTSAASTNADPSLFRTLVQSNINDYNINANRQQTLIQHQEKSLLDEIGSKLYGDPSLHLTGPIEDPSKYPEEKTGGGSEFWKWFTGKPYGEGEAGKPTGYQTGEITLPTGETKEVKFKTTDLTELAKRWKSLQEAKNKKLPTVDMPSFGVYSQPAGNARERAQRIIDDPTASPTAREAAQVYLQMNP